MIDRVEITAGELNDLADEINAACGAALSGKISTKTYIAAQSWHFGLLLSTVGVQVDFGDPEPDSPLDLAKMAYLGSRVMN